MAYPSDDILKEHVSDLGAQNIEFIKIYRDTYHSNILGGGRKRVHERYARDFFTRSLTLSERIDTGARDEHEQRIVRLLDRIDPYAFKTE